MGYKKWGVISLVFLMAQIVFSATRTVSKDGRGEYTSVQEAVNAASMGDIVEILDYEVYDEQVTIDSTKNGLTLRSLNPRLVRKPTIRWKDQVNIHPQTCTEAKDENSINFDQNGAVRLMRVRRVTVDGIRIDGGGAYVFGGPGVWDGSQPCQWALQHGNGALTIWISGDAVIKNCDITNAYIGINFKDRNEGGIFANANPADIKPWNVVPLSGFGKTGNHLVENNRIHNNSFGVWFESTWDLGSVFRYNLFYHNHHSTTTFASSVKSFTSEGSNQPGGCFYFKDHSLSPVAIYNNTFWSNFLFFVGGWRPAPQCLVFNNIHAEPFAYWQPPPQGFDSWTELTPVFVNRMHHSVFAAQSQAPTAYSVQVMNGLQLAQGNGPLPAGHPITTPFPATANIRWFETPFKSTDTASPDFLVPDWDDADVQNLIVDQGWPDAGIRDEDGTIADLGAIPLSGRPPETEILIKPADPVIIDGTTASVLFDVYSIAGTITNPTIKYIRWIKNVEFQEDAFGNGANEIPASDITTVTIPSTPVVLGSNSFTFTIPTRASTELYAFFELVIEGTDESGNTVASTVGFLPYRKLDYTFDVEVWDLASTKQLTEVKAGEAVRLRITPRKVGNSDPLAVAINPVEVTLTSGFDLLSSVNQTVFELPNGIPAGTMTSSSSVMFTKVPTATGGTDRVSVSGVFQSLDANISVAIRGSSDPIRILPGDPAKLAFQEPPSNGVGIIDPGQVYNVKVQVYDIYDNKVDLPATVSMVSEAPTIGNVVGPPSVTTNDTGLAVFQVGVIDGDQNDTFPIVATLAANGATDNAKMVVGKARDRFSIYFGDTLGFDPTAEITGCSGDRVPVTIRATTTGDTIITTRNTLFEFELSPGLAVYATPSELDSVKLTQATLVSGQAVVWVKATGSNVGNGYMTIWPVDDFSILSGTRAGINFVICVSEISKAAYYTDNGYGRVDRVEIYYKDALTANDIPDSILLFWPDMNTLRTVRKLTHYSVTPDAADPRHISVSIQPVFADEVTYSSNSQLGTAYWKDPQLPESQTRQFKFSIADSVGPLLMSALLYERIAPGNDTLVISFSEALDFTLIEGQTLTLTKNAGVTVVNMTVIEAVPIGDNNYRIVVDDAGVNSPVGGDQLQILSTGTIKDLHGNAAHAENRPVTITVKTVPPSIVSAWYEDVDADGIVERLTIDFNKNVNLATMGIWAIWSSVPNPVNDTLKLASLSYGADSSIVIVNLTGAFKSADKVKDMTSGTMDFAATFSEYPGVSVLGLAEDKAAPVLKSATYAPGAALSETATAPDTFSVKFSETTMGHSSPPEPYLFYTVGSVAYSVTLKPVTTSGDAYTYLVDHFTGTESPVNGDFVRMQVDIFTDQGANTQSSLTNKLVPLIVKAMTYPLDVKIGPNPFNPEFDSIRIVIKPITPKSESSIIDADIVIYDQLGNKVFEDKKRNSPQNAEFSWNGRNKKGRKVGNGVYVVYIKGKDITSGVPLDEPPKFIGVKR